VMQILQLSLLVHAKSPTSIKLDWRNWNTRWDATIKRDIQSVPHRRTLTLNPPLLSPLRRQQRCHCHQGCSFCQKLGLYNVLVLASYYEYDIVSQPIMYVNYIFFRWVKYCILYYVVCWSPGMVFPFAPTWSVRRLFANVVCPSPTGSDGIRILTPL
jgi:hypothetical protein